MRIRLPRRVAAPPVRQPAQGPAPAGFLSLLTPQLVRHSGLPSAARRLARNRLLVLAVLIVSGLGAGAAAVTNGATLRLEGDVNANWRGPYDILVRPLGATLDLERTNGLVEPNFLSFAGAGGIGLEQLDAIRQLPAVELAAPVAVVGYLQYVVTAPVAFTSKLPEKPTLYRLTFSVLSSDGIRDVVVQRQAGEILLGPADLATADVPFASYPSSLSWSTDGVSMAFGPLPPIASPLIAVDPAAERQLLGPSAGFLDAFETLATVPRTVASFEAAAIPDEFASQRDLLGLFRAVAAQGSGEAAKRPVIPVAVSRRLYAPLRVTLRVDQVGQPLADYPTAPDTLGRLQQAKVAAGGGLTLVGTTNLDVTEQLRPFQAPSLSVLWPGSAPQNGTETVEGRPPDFAVRLPSRPSYTPLADPLGDAALSYRIERLGTVSMDGTPTTPSTPSSLAVGQIEPGAEAAYRSLRSFDLPLAQGFLPTFDLDRPFVFAPISEFDLGAVDLPDNPLNYVPLGAYAPPETERIADQSGRPVDRLPLTPTLNPAGLLTVPPLAITDLASATLLRGERPIDAIRVRVAGLNQFDAAARARVEQVASQIAALGLQVDIVAGASPQPVHVYVPGYDTSTNPAADLGWVEQGWTTLGAAQRVESGLGDTNRSLLLLSILSALVLVAGLQVLQLAIRAREVAILRALGWGRRRVVGWILGESLLASGLVLVVGLSLWFGTGERSSAGLAAAGLLAAMFPVTAGLGLADAMRRGSLGTIQAGDARSLRDRRTVRSVIGYGVRAALARPARGAATAVGLGVAAAATSLGVWMVASTAARVGPTRLAGALGAALAPYQLGLLCLSAAGSGLLVVVALKLDVADRRQEWRILSASGWGARSIRRALATQRSSLAIPGALLAALLSAITAPAIGATPSLAVAALAAALAASMVVWGSWLADPRQ